MMIKKIAFAEKNDTYKALDAIIQKIAADNNITKASVTIQMDKDEVLIKFTPEG